MSDHITVGDANDCFNLLDVSVAEIEEKLNKLGYRLVKGIAPDYGVDHKLLVGWINSLPEPFRSFVISLETNADPSGNIRNAVCQAENAKALALRVKELEQQLETSHNLMRNAWLVLNSIDKPETQLERDIYNLLSPLV